MNLVYEKQRLDLPIRFYEHADHAGLDAISLRNSMILIFFGDDDDVETRNELIRKLIYSYPLGVSVAGYGAEDSFDILLDIQSRTNPPQHMMTASFEEPDPIESLESFLLSFLPGEEEFDDWDDYKVLATSTLPFTEEEVDRWIKKLQTGMPERKLGEVAEAAVRGVKEAERAIKMVKQAATKGNGDIKMTLEDACEKGLCLESILYLQDPSMHRTEISAIEFRFETCLCVRYTIDMDTDELVRSQSSSLEGSWIELGRIYPDIKSAYGLQLLWAWEMVNHKGYFDAVQLEFTDGTLVQEVIIQFKVAASQIHAFEVVRWDPGHFR